MPKKAVSKPVESSDETSNVQVATKTKQVKAKTPVQESATPAPKAPKTPKVPKAKKAESVAEDSTSKTRVPPTMESVQTDFDTLITSVVAEVENLRKNTAKPKGGVRFLLSLNKSLRRLKAHVQRVSKHRPRVRRANTSSGFLKPVLLSKELSDFTGWDQSVPRSRVDVTKFICSYITDHNLQNPENRKFIMVEKDPKLNALLKYDSKGQKPLDYCHIQTCLKKQGHFLPAPVATPAPSAPPAKATPAPKAKAVKA